MGGKRPKSKARTAAQNSGEGMMAANMAELVERWRKVHGRLADAVAMVAAAKAVAPAAACLIFRGREGFPLARHGFRPSLPRVAGKPGDTPLFAQLGKKGVSPSFKAAVGLCPQTGNGGFPSVGNVSNHSQKCYKGVDGAAVFP